MGKNGGKVERGVDQQQGKKGHAMQIRWKQKIVRRATKVKRKTNKKYGRSREGWPSVCRKPYKPPPTDEENAKKKPHD